ncbi:MAG: putative bifunctional diguanylate cyclase/phosphodiesterase [Solirubrobacteraceae bacterium]
MTSLDAPILVVDDNAGKRLAVRAVLEALGHPIVEAQTGEEALELLSAQVFAVILMDVQMPGLDGYETARRVRELPKSRHTPIIFVTAHAPDETQVPLAYANGAVDFIFGPIVTDTLSAKVSVFADLFLTSRRLEESEARIHSVLDNVADGIVTTTDTGFIESVNRAAIRMFGHTEDEVVGLPLVRLVSSVEGETVGHRRDGTTFPVEVDESQVPSANQNLHIICVRDISERQTYLDRLEHQALHDDLTGLPNRVLFGDRVDHAIRAATRQGEELALLLLDLDDFKQVNDTLGHQHGDALLRQVAERLVSCLRKGDTVARLGGDEFGILPLVATDLAGAASVTWKVQKALEAPFDVDGHSIDMRASIGITLIPEHGDNVGDLLRRADLAMYDAKHSGSGYALFSTEQEEAPAARLELLGNLRHCIERDELVLHYQPKIDLQTREAIGVEALIRWNHPSGRLFMPDQFMPEVERNELMIPITKWVVEESLRQLAAWRADGYDLGVAVNLGARCLGQRDDFFEAINELASAHGVPPGKLTFELTESALIDTAGPGLVAQLESLDERLSIDDFGTGYSSLMYLQRLPVAEIKADRSFVMNMATVAADAIIVRSIIDLAHNLGVQVVAEGVEDEATMDMLIDFGCDEAQGYFFGRPMPGSDIAGWLATSPYGVRPCLAGSL